MEEPELVPKRNLPIAGAIFMLCLGALGLLFSRVNARRNKKKDSQETGEADNTQKT